LKSQREGIVKASALKEEGEGGVGRVKEWHTKQEIMRMR